MLVATEILLQIDSLHYAVDYIPKRALRYFTDPENRLETLPLLLEEMQYVIEHPGEYVEEGSRFLFHALMILGALQEEKGIDLLRQIGLMDREAIDEMLGDRLFDSVSLAIAELYVHKINDLKSLIEDASIDPCIRATCVQSMLLLYGRGSISREEVVSYFLSLLKKPEEHVPFFYEVIALSSVALHPEEMIDELRAFYRDERIDSSYIQLSEIEESLSLSKEETTREFREKLNLHLDDVIAYLETIEEIQQSIAYDRNDPCPCGSNLKFKKCCQ